MQIRAVCSCLVMERWNCVETDWGGTGRVSSFYFFPWESKQNWARWKNRWEVLLYFIEEFSSVSPAKLLMSFCCSFFKREMFRFVFPMTCLFLPSAKKLEGKGWSFCCLKEAQGWGKEGERSKSRETEGIKCLILDTAAKKKITKMVFPCNRVTSPYNAFKTVETTVIINIFFVVHMNLEGERKLLPF